MLIYIFFLHFIADFILQPREMAKNKSTNFSLLLQHVLIQFAVLYIGIFFHHSALLAFKIALLNAIIHGIIDRYIWRLYKWTITARAQPIPSWKYYEDSWFYTFIGLDQFLHISTLTILWWYIK